MAFAKYAYANIIKPEINIPVWDRVRDSAQALGSAFATREASKISLAEFSPKEYMLSHATIVASVDTDKGPGPLGQHLENGFTVDRPYADYLVTQRSARFINNNCCAPGTMILMGDGTEKPIEDVVVGDRVVTHRGRIREVVETFRHPFKGYLREIHRLGDRRRLRITAEHPVWAMTPPMVCACGCGTPLLRRHYRAAQHRFKDLVYGHQHRGRKHAKPDFTWVSSGLLQKGDFLSYPRLCDTVEEAGITPGKAKLIGYFLAEGFYYRQKPYRVNREVLSQVKGWITHNAPVAVNFALHRKERHTLAQAIQTLLRDEFGVDSSVHKSGETNGIYVQSQQSAELVRFFQKHCGEGSHHKRLSPTALFWPVELQQLLIQCYLEGDGCLEVTAGGWLCVTTASASLVSQLSVVLARLGVFAARNVRKTAGRKRVRVANGGCRIEVDPTKSSTSYSLQIGSVHAKSVVQGFLADAYERAIQNRKKHTLSYRMTPESQIFPIRSVEQSWYEGSVYNFETADDHSYVADGVAVHNSDAWERKLLVASFRTFVGGENYLEHLQIPEMSKGKIVDAAARDIGDSVYIDILVATHRKHKPLVAAINSKQLQTLSMGATVAFTLCTKCGNRAADETQLCSHIKYEKGNKFADILGLERKVAELCGHIEEEPGSNKFIEASWVGNPAFPGAVLRNILTQEEAAVYDRLHANRLQIAFSIPAQAPRDSRFAKAARTAEFDFGKEQEEFPGGGAAEEAKPEEDAEPKDPLDSVVDDLAKALTDRAVQKVRTDMGGKTPGHHVQEDHANHTLVPASMNSLRRRLAHAVERLVGDRQSAEKVTRGVLLHRAGGWRAVQASQRFTGRDVLAISRVLDLLRGTPSVAGEARIYRTVVAVGGASAYVDVDSYLAACSQALGRQPTQTEKLALITKGRLFDLGV